MESVEASVTRELPAVILVHPAVILVAPVVHPEPHRDPAVLQREDAALVVPRLAQVDSLPDRTRVVPERHPVARRAVSAPGANEQWRWNR